MTPQNIPTINPVRTSNKVCCFTMILAVPNIPDNKIARQSTSMGLKPNSMLYEMIPPTNIPLLATWVLIFHLKLIKVHNIMHISAATIIPDIYRGK